MKLKEKFIAVCIFVVPITCVLIVVGLLCNHPTLPQVGTAIGTANITTTNENAVYPIYIEDKVPDYFIKITSGEYLDISEMFVNSKLKVVINDEVYWIKLEKEKPNDSSTLLFVDPLEPSTSLTFGDNVGGLSWEDGTMHFEGKVDESAVIFFGFLKPMIDSYIEKELK